MPLEQLELLSGELVASLAIAEIQALGNFRDDDDFVWQHLILLLRGGGGK